MQNGDPACQPQARAGEPQRPASTDGSSCRRMAATPHPRSVRVAARCLPEPRGRADPGPPPDLARQRTPGRGQLHLRHRAPPGQPVKAPGTGPHGPRPGRRNLRPRDLRHAQHHLDRLDPPLGPQRSRRPDRQAGRQKGGKDDPSPSTQDIRLATHGRPQSLGKAPARRTRMDPPGQTVPASPRGQGSLRNRTGMGRARGFPGMHPRG